LQHFFDANRQRGEPSGARPFADGNTCGLTDHVGDISEARVRRDDAGVKLCENPEGIGLKLVIQALAGQKLMTTHSPYFLQHVPLRDIRLVRLRGGCTEIASLPRHIVSDLPWNEALDRFVNGGAGRIFFRDEPSNRVAARCWFDMSMAKRLLRCYRRDPDRSARTDEVRQLRHACRILPSAEDEEELGFHGRRVRGEIFFARRWILVEGVTEYLLVHALGKAFGWPLDTHGVAVIDFQQSGNAGIYPALAEAFGIPWHMIVDGDHEAAKFRQQIIDRGFAEDDLAGHFAMLTAPNSLEDQLIADGHEPLLREILAGIGGRSALVCPADEFGARLKNRKTGYMGVLPLRIAEDEALARRMPAPFVDLVAALRDGGAA
jgi:putative ATP-dependent endonuclease of the OLD family